jgi:hypothetical protein
MGTQDGDDDQQDPERDRPRGDHVGARTHTLNCARARALAPYLAHLWSRRLDEHQPLSRPDFADSAM